MSKDFNPIKGSKFEHIHNMNLGDFSNFMFNVSLYLKSNPELPIYKAMDMALHKDHIFNFGRAELLHSWLLQKEEENDS